MTDVFLDTVGLLATWDDTDQWHGDAVPVYERMTVARTPVMTTSFVLAECANAAARRPYRGAVVRFRAAMESAGRIIIPTAADWDAAWAAYASAGPGGAGLVDQLSFVVMRRLGIADAFTNDRHFKAAGFRTLF